jgi:hypothetical protein
VEIGGGRFYANGFTVDGVTHTWAEQGEPRQNIPKGAVQEFTVNTNRARTGEGRHSDRGNQEPHQLNFKATDAFEGSSQRPDVQTLACDGIRKSVV